MCLSLFCSCPGTLADLLYLLTRMCLPPIQPTSTTTTTITTTTKITTITRPSPMGPGLVRMEVGVREEGSKVRWVWMRWNQRAATLRA